MLKVLDLFSGIGGFSLGLERTGGFETVAFCEIEKYPRAILAQHWPQVRIYNDVKTLTAQQMAADGIVPDVICGGFPCQDISLAGKGAGLEGERSGLWWEFHRLIKEIRPQWVIAENVSALRSRGLDTVLGSLAQIGYDAEWHCIPASAVGAPHRRDRIWIIAYPHTDSIDGRSESQFSDNQGRKTIYGELGRLRPDVADPSSDESEQRCELAEIRRRSDEAEQTGLGSGGIVVADSDSAECKTQFVEPGGNEKSGKRDSGITCDGSRLADTSVAGLQGYEWGWPTGEEGQPVGHIAQCSWWAVEPDVGRVAHGVPKRVDRLKALGNAVVPQIPELLGYAILNAMEK